MPTSMACSAGGRFVTDPHRPVVRELPAREVKEVDDDPAMEVCPWRGSCLSETTARTQASLP